MSYVRRPGREAIPVIRASVFAVAILSSKNPMLLQVADAPPVPRYTNKDSRVVWGASRPQATSVAIESEGQ